MRERIRRELSRDAVSSGLHDIKLGDGGLEELEFSVQYLQLRNCARVPRITATNTMEAILRLGRADIISDADAENLRRIYLFYRTIETTLRLRNETILKEGSDTLRSVAILTGFAEDKLVKQIDHDRKLVKAFIDGLAD
jgi:glutamate-ammonia-ligase adenylyltransferase